MNVGASGAGSSVMNGGGQGIGARATGLKNTSGTNTTGSKSPSKKPTNGGNSLGIGL